jgi:hypothetical protein
VIAIHRRDREADPEGVIGQDKCAPIRRQGGDLPAVVGEITQRQFVTGPEIRWFELSERIDKRGSFRVQIENFAFCGSRTEGFTRQQLLFGRASDAIRKGAADINPEFPPLHRSARLLRDQGHIRT